jgi:hypothetical protein
MTSSKHNPNVHENGGLKKLWDNGNINKWGTKYNK